MRRPRKETLEKLALVIELLKRGYSLRRALKEARLGMEAVV